MASTADIGTISSIGTVSSIGTTSSVEQLFQHLLQQQLSQNQQLPPVDQWQPPLSGELDMHIRRDGSWYYQGSEITRPAMVKLFASILKREGDDYFVLTPVEKWRIRVDDAPFILVAVKREQRGGQQALVFETNTGEQVLLQQDNPLWVDVHPQTAEPSPYLRVRANLPGRINRAVYYQLVDMAVEREVDNRRQLAVSSMGEFYSLGEL